MGFRRSKTELLFWMLNTNLEGAELIGPTHPTLVIVENLEKKIKFLLF